MPESIKQNVPLAPYTTLQIGGPAEYFAEVHTEAELLEATTFANERKLQVTILGGGSNALVSDDGVKGLVIRPHFTDVAYTEAGNDVFVTVGSGVVLDALVAELVAKDIWGLENLSAIPGSVGGVPVQNVGAYGVQVSDTIEHVTAYDIREQEVVTLNNDACAFGYRDSFFKTTRGKDFVILSVTFKLSRVADPKIAYKDLAHYFANNTNPSLAEIRNAVTEIRSKKFPDWHTVGTAGSFFKNPIIPKAKYEDLVATYPDLPGFETEEGMVKIPLGFVLDRILGLRGYREGNVGLYEAQALVLVNYGGATEKEVTAFAQSVLQKVHDATGIEIEWEVTRI